MCCDSEPGWHHSCRLLAAALIERLHETRFYVYDCSGEQHLILFVLGKVLMEGM